MLWAFLLIRHLQEDLPTGCKHTKEKRILILDLLQALKAHVTLHLDKINLSIHGASPLEVVTFSEMLTRCLSKATSATSQQAESHPTKLHHLHQTAKQWVRQLPPNQPWSTCILCAFHSSSRWNAWESPESVLHPAVNNISKFSGHVKQNPEFHGGKQIVYCQVHCGCAETSTNV